MTRIRIVNGQPQICVKDDTLWARHPVAGPLIEQLSEARVTAIYGAVVEDFWRDDAPGIARDFGYDGEAYAEGHSGGWLVLDQSQDWAGYVDTTSSVPLDFAAGVFGVGETYDDEEFRMVSAERKRFIEFAEAIDGAVKAAGEEFVTRLREAISDLERRRDECVVRSEN